MGCNRDMLWIICMEHVINQQIRSLIQQAIDQYEEILATMKSHELQPRGHVPR